MYGTIAIVFNRMGQNFICQFLVDFPNTTPEKFSGIFFGLTYAAFFIFLPLPHGQGVLLSVDIMKAPSIKIEPQCPGCSRIEPLASHSLSRCVCSAPLFFTGLTILTRIRANFINNTGILDTSL
jgi:hypothetical protein